MPEPTPAPTGGSSSSTAMFSGLGGDMTQLLIQGGVVLTAAVVGIVSFAFLIPLDSVPAVTGVSIILAIAYGISLLAWVIVLKYYSTGKESALTWLNTHLMFLVALPATIGATAMNVTAVQNTRNLLAGQIA
jgi:hypothetical protein